MLPWLQAGMHTCWRVANDLAGCSCGVADSEVVCQEFIKVQWLGEVIRAVTYLESQLVLGSECMHMLVTIHGYRPVYVWACIYTHAHNSHAYHCKYVVHKLETVIMSCTMFHTCVQIHSHVHTHVHVWQLYTTHTYGCTVHTYIRTCMVVVWNTCNPNTCTMYLYVLYMHVLTIYYAYVCKQTSMGSAQLARTDHLFPIEVKVSG